MLADPRQLLAAEAVENAVDAHDAAQRDFARVALAHFADPRRRSARHDRGQGVATAFCLCDRYDRDEPAFICDMKRIRLRGHAPRTSSETGTEFSSKAIDRPAVSAISITAVARPPRVRSRRQCTSMPAASKAATEGQSEAQSLIGDSNASPLAGRECRGARCRR